MTALTVAIYFSVLVFYGHLLPDFFSFLLLLSMRLFHIILLLLATIVILIADRRKATYMIFIAFSFVVAMAIERSLFYSDSADFRQVIVLESILFLCISMLVFLMRRIGFPIKFQFFIATWLSVLLPPFSFMILLSIRYPYGFI
ncbi:MAG: hypothetical protein ACFB12_02975 [Leptolyngbyaceae cyanobacterium]